MFQIYKSVLSIHTKNTGKGTCGINVMVGLLMAIGGDVAATAFGTMCELGWIGAAVVMVVVVEFFTANLNWLNAGVQQPLQEGLALLAVPHIYRL